jgi:hypothetical protein
LPGDDFRRILDGMNQPPPAPLPTIKPASSPAGLIGRLAGSAIGGALGLKTACEGVFAHFASSSLYPDDVERAIKAVNRCVEEDAFALGLFSAGAGFLVGRAFSRANPFAAAVGSLIAAVIAGAIAGYVYYLRW